MSPSQIARERMAEETARYHQHEYVRWLDTWTDMDPDDLEESETRRRVLFHWREIKAAKVRLVAIQLEGVTFDDLLALRRAA